MLSAHLPWQTMKKMSEAHKIPDANERKTAAQGLDKSIHTLLGNEAYKQYRTEAAAKHQAAAATRAVSAAAPVYCATSGSTAHLHCAPETPRPLCTCSSRRTVAQARGGTRLPRCQTRPAAPARRTSATR